MHYLYDDRGRLVQTLAPGNTGSTLSYSGLRKTVTSGLYWNNSALVNRGVAATTSFDSDALGRLVGVTDALSQPTTYAYDDADRINQVIQTDPAYPTRTQTRTWAYNTLGWMLSLTQPESGTTSYSAFDVSGKPWTTSYNGRVVNGTFDALGRMLTLKSVAPDASVDQAFTWDTAPSNGKGKLRTATANGVTREMDYGGVGGRLSTLTRTVDGIPFVQRFTYDTYGNLISRTYPDNKVQTLTPDLATGLPVTSVFNGVSVMPVATYDVTHWGLTTLTLANGATSLFTYGPDQTRLNSLRHQVSGKLDRKWTYGYDDQSRLLTAVGSDVQNTVGFRQDEERYTYDALGRLKTAMVRDPWDTTTGYANRGLFQSFDYDPFGNRFTGNTATITNWPANQPPATATLSASLRAGLDKAVANVAFSRTDAAFLQNRLPASAGSVYDAQGNLTQVFPRVGASGESVNLAYDALGRVSSLSYGPTATRKSESYLHDDEGLRIRVWDGAKYRYNLYNEARQLIAQYEKIGAGSLTWKKDIVYVGTKELAEVSSDGKTYVTLNDHLGGPRFLFDGTTLSQQKFLPFGETLADALTAAKFAKGFTNHEQTDASGLIYMQARFYLPQYGRFGSPDPKLDQHFQDTQSWNIYSYVRNGPTMKIDPRGEDARITMDKEKKSINIQLPVVLTSKSVSPADFKKAIEKQWNNGGKGFQTQVPQKGLLGALGKKDTYTVTFTATVVAAGDKKGVEALKKEFGSTVNKVTLSDDVHAQRSAAPDGTGVSQVQGTVGAFRNYTDFREAPGAYQHVWSHEVGHFLGLPDITIGGQNSNIMKNSTSGSVGIDHINQTIRPMISASEKGSTQVDVKSSESD